MKDNSKKILVYNVVFAAILIIANVILSLTLNGLSDHAQLNYGKYASVWLGNTYNIIKALLNTAYVIGLIIAIRRMNKVCGKVSAKRFIVSHFLIMLLFFIVNVCVFIIYYNPLIYTIIIGLIFIVAYSSNEDNKKREP